uniref:Uncharacterized protein n=1 Tax=Anguilla anguilla TaxID=7936 RepID=A0A0E9W133_ANGAN
MVFVPATVHVYCLIEWVHSKIPSVNSTLNR